MSRPLELCPDRLFPTDPTERAIARDLYERVRQMPIISPHGHVNPSLLVDNESFGNATELLLRWDHYIFRLLFAAGVDLAEFGVGGTPLNDPRAAWKTFCEHWYLIAGTASALWMTQILVELFGVEHYPSAETADTIYDQIQQVIDRPDFRPRELFNRFGIELLATTDDPLDSLEAHHALAARDDLGGRVTPTWRPDKYCWMGSPDFVDAVEALAASVGGSAGSIVTYLDALRASRQRFVAAGAISADHGPHSPKTVDLDDAQLQALLNKGLAGTATMEECHAFEGAMLVRCAGFSVEDGLTMTIHPSVYRNHCSSMFNTFGRDTGHDIPLRTEYTRALRPLLEKYGCDPRLHLVLFTIDETVFSRELAPLAGFYPSVFVGAPWWFIDSPDAIARHRSAVVEQAGFYRSSGFIDDTRAYLSIPARHDMSRRVDAGFLAGYVAKGRVSLASAERILEDMTGTIPRTVFRVDR